MSLRLSHIRAVDLMDTGTAAAPQCPAVKVRTILNGVDKSTPWTCEGQREGSSPSLTDFTGERYEVSVDPKDYGNGLDMEIEVINEYKEGSPVHVGKAIIVIKDLLSAHNKQTPIKIDLTYYSPKGQEVSKGVLYMYGILDVTFGDPDAQTELLSAAPTKKSGLARFKSAAKKAGMISAGMNRIRREKAEKLKEKGPIIREYILTLDSMRAVDLTNTGTMLDPQDPALYLKIGTGRLFNTKRQQDAGTKATFTGEIFETTIHPAELEHGLAIDAEVVNEGLIGSKVHIGDGKVLVKAAITELSKAVWFTVDLTHRGKKADVKKGVLHFRGRMEPVYEGHDGEAIEDDKDAAEIAKQMVDIERFMLKITNIKADDLFDTGSLLEPQNPCTIFKYHNREYKTDRVVNGKTAGVFKDNEIKIKVDPNDFARKSDKVLHTTQ